MMRWLKKISIGIFAIFFALAFKFGMDLYDLFYKPMPILSHKRVVIQIDKTMSARAFVHALQEQHLIHSSRLFLALIRLQGLAMQLKAGIYQVKPGESAQQFLYRVLAGDVLIETFRIVEGSTQKQIMAQLEKSPYLNYQATDWTSILDSHSTAEGLLLADTYQYNSGSNAKALLSRANADLKHYLNDRWQKRSLGLPYRNSYEMLIAASILEKETAIPSERRLIAGVIVNRLRKYMPLQMDPTVIYALGAQYQGKLSHEDLQFDSPFNTYRYRGLPPTPIAMVGKEAIDAAANPEMTDFLYFVAKGDGSHQFSSTYVQQKQAITRYLKSKRTL